jgi:hypothetical protein
VDWDALSHDLNAETIFELTHARRPAPGDKVLVDKVKKELSHSEDGHIGAGFLCLAAPSFQWR